MKRTLFILIFLCLLWQLAIMLTGAPSYFLPSPSAVFLTIWQEKFLLLSSAAITLAEACLGFFLAFIFACLAALVFFHYQKLGHLFLPVLVMSQALPTLAIAPLLILWLGYGLTSKIILVMMMLFFPITSAFLDGLRRVNPLWLATAELMTDHSKRILWHVQIPAALPALASGIRIASAGALIGAVIGEWVGATQGLGFLLLEANARFQTTLVFATLVVLLALSLTFFRLVNWLLNCLITW